MREQFGEYLDKYRDYTHKWVNSLDNTRAIVFLEDEKSYWWKPLLQNYAEYMGEGWNLYLVTTPKNYQFMQDLVTGMGWNVVVRNIQDLIPDVPHNMSGDTFNRIFKTEEWWSWFTEDTLLTAQLDTVLLRPFEEKWLEYDMVGAPCNWFTLNGGLCLRKREAMLRALREPSYQDMRYSPCAEDVYFTSVLRNTGGKLPTREEATQFALENFPVNVGEFSCSPFGVHGTNKYYLQDEVVTALMTGGEFKIQKKPRVMIASPVYKWPPHPKFAESLQRCQSDPRFEVEFRSVQGDAHIERARSMLLLQYLTCTNPCDWYVMVDSDIEFNGDIIWGIINRGKDVIGAAYSFKSPEGTPKYQQPVIRGLTDETPTNDGLLKVRHLGGGFTVVSDRFIREMCDHYRDLEFMMNPDLLNGSEKQITYGLWNPVLIDQENWPKREDGTYYKEMLSEDYSFCERIIMMGREVWLDLNCYIAHWDGDKCYQLKIQEPAEPVQEPNV